MGRLHPVLAALVFALGGCLEKDPDYIPPDSSAGDADASTTGSGTADAGTTESESTETGVMCDPPMTLCSSSCVDTDTDKNNCGACFSKCQPAQEICVAGMCEPK